MGTEKKPLYSFGHSCCSNFYYFTNRTKNVSATVCFFNILLFFLLSAGLFILPINKNVRSFLIIVLFFFAFVSSGLFFNYGSLAIINDIIVLVYCILLSWAVLIRTFSDGPVSVHRIQGAIVVYLLISFIFALLYHSVFLIGGDSVFKSENPFDRKESMYFSLVTVSTVGYGDIAPAVAVTKSLADMESLIGQLYPTILIARLVPVVFESSKRK